MIGRIRGILLEKKPPRLLLDVNGLGYEIDSPLCSFYRLPALGEEVVLFTHFIVREDAQMLFGFTQEQERSLFRDLIKVSAVGPKLALAILSGMEADAFVDCVLNDDVASLTRIPGVGKKTAERLMIEMRDRLGDWHRGQELPANIGQIKVNDISQEAIAALIALGYKPNEARTAVKQVTNQPESCEELIRQALRGMIKGSNNASRTID